MADATTHVKFSVPGVGVSYWGRIPTAEAKQKALDYYRHELLRVKAVIAELEEGGGQVTWWNGTKQLADPEAPHGGK